MERNAPFGLPDNAEAEGEGQQLPCLVLLRGLYPRLPDAERRVADYMLTNPERVLLSSVAEVARGSAAGVGTVARLATKLGYGGFPDLKTALAFELLNPTMSAPELIHEDDESSAVFQKVFRFGAHNLQDTAALLDLREFERAVQAIVRARRVELYAMGAIAGAMAAVAYHRFLVLGVHCAVVTHPRQQVLAAGLLSVGDVAIAFSNSGESEEVVNALGAARAAGATTICITNAPQSTLTRIADICLLTAARETGPSLHAAVSHVAMLGAVDALYAAAVLHKYRDRATRESVPATETTPDR